jgi:hypothetical protein
MVHHLFEVWHLRTLAPEATDLRGGTQTYLFQARSVRDTAPRPRLGTVD